MISEPRIDIRDKAFMEEGQSRQIIAEVGSPRGAANAKMTDNGSCAINNLHPNPTHEG